MRACLLSQVTKTQHTISHCLVLYMTVPLQGKCEASTKCQAYKRGVYKCVPLDPKLGQMPINTVSCSLALMCSSAQHVCRTQPM